MAKNVLNPADLAYYAQQARAVRNTQAFGQKENTNAEKGADLTYSQRITALQEKLTQQQDALPDKFAARGIENSGIYNYGGGNQAYTGAENGSGWNRYGGIRGSQFGALQQFKFDSTTALNDLRNQQTNVDQGYGLRLGDLNNVEHNQLDQIGKTEAAQNAAQAAADAIGVG